MKNYRINVYDLTFGFNSYTDFSAENDRDALAFFRGYARENYETFLSFEFVSIEYGRVRVLKRVNG